MSGSNIYVDQFKTTDGRAPGAQKRLEWPLYLSLVGGSAPRTSSKISCKRN